MSGLLSKPGESFEAKITSNGRLIAKVVKENLKKTLIKYPNNTTVTITSTKF